MLVYIVGVPGSGKSYKAVKHIYDNFVKEENEKYIYCYTNINQFDFSISEKIRKLDFDDFKEKINILYDLYKNKATDEELNKKAQELEIYKSLFVIDEAHNYFQTKDDILVWWLTYHRHLYQDIFLITQNLALIDRKYKPLAEYFYKAVPASLRLNKKIFKYKIYIDSRMTKASEAGIEKLKFDENVIKLYHSGDVVNAPNFMLKFILFALIFLIIVSVYFYFYTHNLKNQGKEEKQIEETNTITTQKNLSHSSQEEKKQETKRHSYNIKHYKFYYKVICFKSKCIVKNIDTIFPKKFLLNIEDIKIIYKSNTNFFVVSDIDLSKFKGQTNDETTSNNFFTNNR